MARPTLTDIAETMLRARPSATTAELAREAVARRATRAKDPEASIRRALEWDLRFLEVRGDVWVLTTRIAASPVTHRITADEAASDTLALGIDLATLAPFVVRDLTTADGTRLQVLRGRTASVATGLDTGVAFRGPGGWPGFEAGALVEVWLDGTTVRVQAGREPSAADRMRGRRLVSVARSAVERADRVGEVGRFVEGLEALAAFAADDADALATPLPPLSEVLDGSGLVHHHAAIGLPGTDWAALDALTTRIRRRLAFRTMEDGDEDDSDDDGELDDEDPQPGGDGADERAGRELHRAPGRAGTGNGSSATEPADRPMPPTLRLLPGRDDADEPPGFDDRILHDLVDWHDLPPDEALTLGILLDLFVVWHVPGTAGSPPSASTTMRRNLAELLGVPRVAMAVADYATTDPRVEAFARDLAAATSSRDEGAGPAFVLGAIAEARADLAEAERWFRQATALDAWCVPAQLALLDMEIARGDAAAAAARMRRLEYPADDPDYRWVAGRLGSAVPRVGRNDPCPCGSGRKYKACHLDRPAALLETDPVDALEFKLARFMRGPGPGRALEALVHEALVPGLGDDPDEAAAAVHADAWLTTAEERLLGEDAAFTSEILLYEGGLVRRFLEVRGPLLPPAERALAETWASSRVGLYEVVAARPGRGVALRDLVGDRGDIEVRDAAMSRSLAPLDVALMRLRPDGRGGEVPSQGALIPRLRRLAVEGLVRRGDVHGMLRLLALPEPTPRVHTADGDPLVLVTTRYELPDPDLAQTALRAVLDVDGPGRFVALSASRKGSIEGTITIEGATATLFANSLRRADALARTLESAAPGARVIERREERVQDLLASPEAALRAGRGEPQASHVPSSGSVPARAPEDGVMAMPGAREALDAAIRAYEAAWVDDHIPALGGRTPREAIADPAGRRQVEALLNDIAWTNDRAVADDRTGTMDPDRLRDRLGLPRRRSRS